MNDTPNMEDKWQRAFAAQSHKLHHILKHLGHSQFSEIMNSYDGGIRASKEESPDVLNEVTSIGMIFEKLYRTEAKLEEVSKKFEELKRQHFMLSDYSLHTSCQYEKLEEQFDSLSEAFNSLEEDAMALDGKNSSLENYHDQASSLIAEIKDMVKNVPPQYSLGDITETTDTNGDTLYDIDILLRHFHNGLR